MIENLKPYPAYKDSGLHWLGEVPAHWEIRPAAGIFSPICERNTGMKENTILSLSYGRIVVKPAERLQGLVPESFETYQIVNPGDIVIRTTDLQNDKTSLRTGFVHDRGIITSAYLALSASAGVLPEFGYQFLNTWDISKAIYGYGSGLRQNLDFSDFRRMSVSVPPITEQAAIARILAWATNRLDRAIVAKRRIIALLQEQKQAIIHRAVTRGLDPSVPLKDSRIPWLGETPEHWEIAGLGRLCIARCDGPFGSGLKSSHYTDSGIRVIRLQNIGIGEFRGGSRAYISPEHYASLGNHDVLAGDLLVAGLGDEKVPAGRACLAPPNCEPAMVKADCFRFRMKGGKNVPRFLAMQLSATAQAATACLSTGATRLRINLSATSARSVALPPLPEQEAILDHIQEETTPLSSAIIRLEEEMTLLREYRTRLIADVVTGKLDVREVAARLPEEIESDDAQDATEEDLDLDAEDEVPENLA
jgi:type I restriction enzyme S subunit